MQNMLNDGHIKHNFISSSGTAINYGSGYDFLISYGSGSAGQKVPVPVPVLVPQHWIHGVATSGNVNLKEFI